MVFIYRYRQAAQIQQSLERTSPNWHCCYCESCLIVAVWYLCSNRQVKRINNSLKQWSKLILYSTEFSAATNLLWSFSVRKSAGLKSSIIIFLHTFTQLNLIGNQRQQFCPVRARKRRRRNSGYPYCRQITTGSHLSCRGFSLFIVGKVSGLFSFKTQL